MRKIRIEHKNLLEKDLEQDQKEQDQSRFVNESQIVISINLF